MKDDIWMCGKPAFVLLVDVQVVQDDVDFPVSRLAGNYLAHEYLEVRMFLGLFRLAANNR